MTDATPKKFREYYSYRRRHKTQYGDAPTNGTLHKDATLLRQILSHAVEEGHIAQLPLIPRPGKIEKLPRPWLTRDEWTRLATLAILRVTDAPNARTRRQRDDLFDFMMFMVESMMRVGELRQLTVAQVEVKPPQNGEPEHLSIDVHGKRGHRTVPVGGAAVGIFKARAKHLKPSDKLWQYGQRDAFRELLIAAGLRTDAFGTERNLKSLRVTAISFRVLAGAPALNLVMIARAAGTSIQQLNDFYLARLTAQMAVNELTMSVT